MLFCLRFLRNLFADIAKMIKFAPLKTKSVLNARIAQLVEHHLAKVRVASSSLVSRSKEKAPETGLFYLLGVETPIRRNLIVNIVSHILIIYTSINLLCT